MDRTTNRPAPWTLRRRGTGAALVIAALAVLAGCTPSSGKVESHTATLAARSVGIGVTSSQLDCTTDQVGSVLGSTVVEASCRITGTACCVIPVTATYRDGRAAATASLDATTLSGRWWREGGRWWVTCSWVDGDAGWTATGCTTPTHNQRT